MALFELNLDIDTEYKKMIEQYLFILCSLIFMIMLEPVEKFNAVSFLFYNILGMVFYNLVVKQVISFN